MPELKEETEMKLHEIKLARDFVNQVNSGSKSFEIRKNDRDYKRFDLIRFISTDGQNLFAGLYVIDYILYHADFPDGVPKEYCVFSIKKFHGEVFCD